MTTLNLTFRQRQPELMDQPGLDERTHRKALAGIQRVNDISRIGYVLWRAIDRVIMERHLESVRVLDIACGGGDLAICLAGHALRRNVDFSADGCDINRTAVAHAKAQAVAANADNVHFFESDALSESFDKSSRGQYDIVMCSLFLHHLEENQAVKILRKMATSVRHAVIIDDLRRTRLGYGLAWIGCRLLTRSPMVHVDGPLSVQGAFTVEEARSLAERAGMQNARIVKHWPQRFLMTWQRT
jgi:2-polyprenyl-3-methyl-5-hydroxy-6-metoxy-1,4-benzoquinol methylase